MRTLTDEAESLLDNGGAHATTRACWLARAALEDSIGDLLAAAGLVRQFVAAASAWEGGR